MKNCDRLHLPSEYDEGPWMRSPALTALLAAHGAGSSRTDSQAKKKPLSVRSGAFLQLAEREGFEPSIEF